MSPIRLSTILIAVLAAAPAAAETFHVTNPGNDGVGSLRAAILAVNASVEEAHVIVFDESYPEDGLLELYSALPPIDRPDVVVDGGGRWPLLLPYEAANSFTFFRAGPSLQRLRLQGMDLRQGRSSTPGGSGGGCIADNSGGTPSLELVEMRFRNCVASESGFAKGGAVLWGEGVMSVQRSEFYENGAFSQGNSHAGGGAIYAQGPLLVEKSIFVDNAAGGRTAFGGAIVALSSATIVDSQFTYNTVIADGSSNDYATGGAVAIDCFADCTAQIARSHFGFNGGPLVDDAGAVYARSNASQMSLSISNVSFDENTAIRAGALALDYLSVDARHLTFVRNVGLPAHLRAMASAGQNVTLALDNTVMTTASTPGCDIGITATADATFVGDPTCAAMLPGTTQVPDLQALPTVLALPMSHVPFAAGTPVIDTTAITDCGSEDVRGAPRPVDGDDDGTARCDAGAYEHPGAALFADGFEP